MSTNKTIKILKSRLYKGGFWALSGKILSSFGGIAVNFFLARLLSPEELGEFFLLQTIVLTIVTFSLGGFDNAISRFVAQKIAQNNKGGLSQLIFKIFLFVLIISLIVLSFLGLLRKSVINYLNLSFINDLIYFVVFWIIFIIGLTLISETFRGMHKISLATIFGSPVRGGVAYYVFFSLILLLFFVNRAEIGLYSVIISIIIILSSIFIFGTIILIRILKTFKNDSKNEKINWRSMFFIVFPLFLSSLVMLILTKSDIWIISYFLGNKEVAIYGVAAKLGYLVSSSLVIINAFLPPIISDLFVKKEILLLEKTLRVSATVATIPAIFITFVFFVFGGSILSSIFGHFYMQSSRVLAILSFGQLVNVFGGSASFVLIMTQYEKQSLFFTVISGVITVLVSIFLSFSWGISGVAFGFTFGVVLRKIMMMIYVRRKLGIKTYSYFSLNEIFKLTTNIKNLIRK